MNPKKLSYNSQIVIVDNDPEIISFWQKILLKHRIKGKFFTTSQEFIEWYTNSDKQDISLLINYDLGSGQLNGLQTLINFNLKNSYLITGYADQQWLQMQLKNTGYYLIPKSVLEQIGIIFI